ncbi:hypothetical protein [Sphingomonas sp.]|uniref:hypothetical protein n=2 Tax=Sphingomonadales TaxID=204457 RepID=UPI0035C7D52E
MTDATPLASEQITEHRRFIAAARDFYDAGPDKFSPGYEQYGDLLHAAEALSATPAHSDQDASQAQGEVHPSKAMAPLQGDNLRMAAALKAVRGAMLNGGDGATGDFGWNITALNKARKLVRDALESKEPYFAPGARAQDGVDHLPDAGKMMPTPTIPAGMVAVPRVATPEMRAAGAEYAWQSENDVAECYRIMIAAAPKQAEQQGAGKWEGPPYEYGITWGPDGGQDGAA